MKKIEKKRVLFLNDDGEMVGRVAVLESDLDELEQQMDEAVEVLIDSLLMLEIYEHSHIDQNGVGMSSLHNIAKRYNEKKKLIESLTGQTWEEIKADYKND